MINFKNLWLIIVILLLSACDQGSGDKRGIFIKASYPTLIDANLSFKNITSNFSENKRPNINFNWNIKLNTNNSLGSKINIELVLYKNNKKQIIKQNTIEIQKNKLNEISISGSLTANFLITALEAFIEDKQNLKNINWQLKASSKINTVESNNIYLQDLKLNSSDNKNLIEYIKSSDSQFSGNFGSTLALSNDGNTLIVGAPNHNDSGNFYIFEKSNNNSEWQEVFNFNDENLTQIDYKSIARKVAISANGNIIAVSGINNKDDNIVYLYKKQIHNNWHFSKKIISPNKNSNFGIALSLSKNGNFLVVGAPNDFNNEGRAYIYSQKDDYTNKQLIKAFNNDIGDEFGSALVISDDGEIIAVGTPYEDSEAFDLAKNKNIYNIDCKKSLNEIGCNNNIKLSGSVYIFEHINNNWENTALIKAEDSQKTAEFGKSLDLTKDINNNITLIVGAPEHSEITNSASDNTPTIKHNSGKVYIFKKQQNTAWKQIKTIKAPNLDSTDEFGSSIVISRDGNYLFISAIYESELTKGINKYSTNLNQASSSGAVYMYKKNDNNLFAYIKASNTNETDKFGAAIDTTYNGKSLIVGAKGEKNDSQGINGMQNNLTAKDSGAIYVY